MSSASEISSRTGRRVVSVQAGGFSAQCPRCESEHFTAAAAHLLACHACGAHVPHAALLHQIAAKAQATASVLAEYAHRARLMAN